MSILYLKVNSRHKIKKNRLPSFLLFFWLMETYFMTIARFILTKLGLETGLFRNIILFFIASVPLIVFFINIRQFNEKQYGAWIVLYIAVIFSILVTLLLYPERMDYIVRTGYGIDRVIKPECAIFAYLFFSIVDRPEDIIEVVRKFCVYDFIFLIVLQLVPRLISGYFSDVNYEGIIVKRPYSLSFGYSMLLPVIVFLYIFITRKKILYLICAFLGGVTIFLYGNRGALGMIIIFLCLMTIDNIRECKDTSYKIFKIMIVSLLAIVGVLFLNKIVIELVHILHSFGIESRTLNFLAAGDILDTSGRDVLWDAVIKAIHKQGAFGYGFFGDRPFVGPIHYVGYAHNIFLELVVSFGVIGIVIIAKICFDSIYMLFVCKDKKWRQVFIIFFSVSCQLLISMSMWYVMEFWAMLAISHKCFNIKKRNNTRTEYHSFVKRRL